MSSKRLVVVLVTSAAVAALAACAPTEDAPRNGVNDVRAACEIRASWTNAGRDVCVNCLASAAAPACECESFKEFAGLCYSQDQARLAEPSCTTPVKDCAHNCKNDCGCVEACYASAEACKRAVAATDGCVTDVCAKHCQ